MCAKLSLADAQKWIVNFPTSRTAQPSVILSPYRARLLCFHWAGGNAQTFRPWSKFLQSDDIHVAAVMLPGRMSRGAEKIPTDIHEIADSLYQCLHLLNYLDPTQPPLIFFGHSYGGIIAYELSLLLLRNDYLLPHLIISSTNNPSLLNARSAGTVVSKKHHLLSDEELLQEVLRHGGLPAGVHLDILRHMLPVIRGDYKGLETYSFSLPVSSDEQHLPSSLATYPGYLTVLGSEQDPGDVTQASLYGWRDYSQASDERFSIHLFPSQSHFYFLEPCNSTDFFEKIREICLNPLQQPYPPLPLLT